MAGCKVVEDSVEAGRADSLVLGVASSSESSSHPTSSSVEAAAPIIKLENYA